MGKIKKIYKRNKKTLVVFFISFIISMPLNMGLLAMVGMSTDASMNEFSIFILSDLIQLIWMIFMPFVMLLLLFHFIPILIMISENKKVHGKYNIILYIVLLLIQSLPFGVSLFKLHVNTSLDYIEERKLEKKLQEEELIEIRKIRKGELTESSDLYKLSIRYLSLNNIEDIKNMAKQDKLLLSYEYDYIFKYLTDVDYGNKEKYHLLALSIYNMDFPDVSYRYQDNNIDLYLEIIDSFIKEDISVEAAHNKIKKFMNRKFYFSYGDKDSEDFIKIFLPMIITYESIYLLNKADENLDLNDEEITSLDVAIYLSEFRVSNYLMYLKNNHIITKEDESICIEYSDMLSDLYKDKDNLTNERVSKAINEFSKKHNLNLKNKNLNMLQVLMYG